MNRRDDIVIALAGNPNCGKTSLYNYITGSRQHVGNYPGVTVERKEGAVPVDDAVVTFVDLPGTYSLSPFSIEEYVARHEILSSNVQAIIVVVDTTRLERNLYFASQVIETGKPVVLALNMFDEFEASGNELEIGQLSAILGVPCIPTIGNRGKGVLELMSVSLKAARGEIPSTGKTPRYSHEMEHAIEAVEKIIGEKSPYSPRWTAVNLLMYGESFVNISDKTVFSPEIFREIEAVRTELEALEGCAIKNIVTSGRYGFASGAVRECMREKRKTITSTTDKIDTILTHRWLGLPIFFLTLWMMFQATFTLGELPVQLIGWLFQLAGQLVSRALPPGMLSSLVVDGVIAGVGGVVMFLPNILILFFFISLMEDTGYMARAAFIMDRIMHFLGLHGKSFMPMLVGFGCTVPAIMATRILESRRERMITMFVIPFMSCGARLPVYILLAGAFFGREHAGTVIFSLYITGMILSFAIAKILSFMVKTPSSFVMELPPYRVPTTRSVLLHIWERAWMYLRKAGTIILAASLAVWIMVTFPKVDGADAHFGPAASLEQTYAGKFGKAIEPLLKPLGFDWRIGVALSTGFAAKEVIVSTLGTIYAVEEDSGKDSRTENLQITLRNDPSLDPIKAYGLMLFILIYIPCIAVLGVLKREAGGWKWVGLMVVYTTTLAWLVSFAFIRTASLFL